MRGQALEDVTGQVEEGVVDRTVDLEATVEEAGRVAIYEHAEASFKVLTFVAEEAGQHGVLYALDGDGKQ